MEQFDYKFKYVTKLDLDSAVASLLSEELRKKSLGVTYFIFRGKTLVHEQAMVK